MPQWGQNIANSVSQWVQNAGSQAKGFFTGLWDNIKSKFSTKDANDILQQASAPLEHPQTPVAPQPAAPVAASPVAPQPAAPVAAAPVATSPVAPQPAAEVQPGDIQQPTQTA